MAHQPHARSRGQGQGEALSGGETIAAVATPAGRGGIGIVRLSGPRARAIAHAVTGADLEPRRARLCDFVDAKGRVIDQGIALLFPAPHSYTGEDVVELQGHGGAMVMRQLLQRCIDLGARTAQPGEFTRRAFLNDRIDLAQAESVADLIDAASEEAALSAARSLRGEFSARIDALVSALTTLRAHVEACIDFPEEEIDPADRRDQAMQLAAIRRDLDAVLRAAGQGAVLREGLTVVLAGAPNVGKSSLLNRLAGEDLAIVTPIPGTTRDPVRATVLIDGVPIHLVDTAGLRDTQDEVERIGVERTRRAVREAGAVLAVQEASEDASPRDAALDSPGMPVLLVKNKIDLGGQAAGLRDGVAWVSARTGEGMPALREWLLATAGWKPHGEGVFMARTRHLRALQEACRHLEAAAETQAFELMAEDLRLAQAALGTITGEVSADSLLGDIFSRFCIGK